MNKLPVKYETVPHRLYYFTDSRTPFVYLDYEQPVTIPVLDIKALFRHDDVAFGKYADRILGIHQRLAEKGLL